MNRTKPIPRVNRERKKRLFAEDFYSQEFVDFIHSLPCALCGIRRNVEAAHVRSRGAGGKAKDVVPLCGEMFYGRAMSCHSRYDLDADFRYDHKPTLTALAASLWAQFNEGTT